MSRSHLFKSIHITNYRKFYDISVNDFKLINIVAGKNGAGKSTFLESLFAIADCKDPSTFFKSLGWKGINASFDDIHSIFNMGNKLEKIFISAESSLGAIDIELQQTEDGTKLNIFSNETEPANLQTSSTSNMKNYKYIATINKRSIANYIISPTGIVPSNTGNSNNATLPTCVMNSRWLLGTHQETTNRFSSIIKDGSKDKVIKVIQSLIPEVEDLIILTSNGQPTVYGVLDKKPLPLLMLGDGAILILTISVQILTCPNGAVFLDEFDTAIHTSALVQIWESLSRLAANTNCQIFATTHSMECIEAALEGIEKTGLTDDFKYMRISKEKNIVTSYTFDDLKNAVTRDWEVR